MGLVVCVPKSEALRASRLNEQISDICEEVISDEDRLLFVPRPGEVMALLQVLNEEGIRYSFHHAARDKE
jgi:hypothetical protein